MDLPSGVNRCFMPLIRQITWMVRIGEGNPACGMAEQGPQRGWQAGMMGQNAGVKSDGAKSRTYYNDLTLTVLYVILRGREVLQYYAQRGYQWLPKSKCSLRLFYNV